MNKTKIDNQDYHTVQKIESGFYEYDTIFIIVNDIETQVPIKKGIYKVDNILNKSIKIQLNNIIEKVEFQN